MQDRMYFDSERKYSLADLSLSISMTGAPSTRRIMETEAETDSSEVLFAMRV